MKPCPVDNHVENRQQASLHMQEFSSAFMLHNLATETVNMGTNDGSDS